MEYARVVIPTNQDFLAQWYKWVLGEVSQYFRRNKDRIPDTAQNVRIRLLAKNFIGRWFYKHLSDELVDTEQAIRILGGAKVPFIGSLMPIGGRPTTPNSLWRVSDLLRYAQFDYDRYFYSIQGHTIDSDRVLKLLGYEAGKYESLASLYRQGRLKPSELTEHMCSGKKCPECKHGRASLKTKHLSLAHRWELPEVAAEAAKLRWNDSQLAPFLREWRRQNIVRHTPLYIMRPVEANGKPHGIDAGLLKYAKILIRNEVVNDFKRMTRTDDMTNMVFNDGVSPDVADVEMVSWEVDDDETKQCVFLDPDAKMEFETIENKNDISALANNADLTADEIDVVKCVDLLAMTVREYAVRTGKPIPRVHRLRNGALKKLRGSLSEDRIKAITQGVCNQFGCTQEELLGQSVVGPTVLARTRLFSLLYDAGMSIQDMRMYFSYPENKITAAINRQCLHDMASS